MNLLDFLYPQKNICLNCHTNYIWSGVTGLCNQCLSKVEFVTNYCQHCGRIINENKKMCKKCSSETTYYDLVRSIAHYHGIFRKILLQYKYYHLLEFIRPLAELLKIYFNHYFYNIKIDYFIAIPLHKNRLKKRGFNQVQLLAEEVMIEYNIPLLVNVLTRTKETPPLFNFSEKDRKNFIKGCFKTKTGCLKGKTVLLLDDIFTTGTTVNEASYVLKREAGADRVYVLTLATAKMFEIY